MIFLYMKGGFHYPSSSSFNFPLDSKLYVWKLKQQYIIWFLRTVRWLKEPLLKKTEISRLAKKESFKIR